ncbi:MAG: hypothetical protein Q7R81_08005 [Candidatus Peregrinibacteria bacterium]|nr:hypothetical protein [Candidatus Peregrinibacteria bacterium]
MRENKTFGSNDLVRFWTLNLTDKERQEVVAVFLYEESRCEAAKNIVLLILEFIVSAVPFPGIQLLLRILLKLVPPDERIPGEFIQDTALRVIQEAGLEEIEVQYKLCRAVLEKE